MKLLKITESPRTQVAASICVNLTHPVFCRLLQQPGSICLMVIMNVNIVDILCVIPFWPTGALFTHLLALWSPCICSLSGLICFLLSRFFFNTICRGKNQGCPGELTILVGCELKMTGWAVFYSTKKMKFFTVMHPLHCHSCVSPMKPISDF